MDIIKTAALLLVLTLIFVLIGNLIAGQQGMIVALIFAAIMNMLTYWFSDKIVLFMYRAKPLPEQDAPKVHHIIQKLCDNSHLPKPKVYIMPIDVPNAFATGRNPRHAAVCVTRGIMNALSDEELEGVLAHELAHVKSRHILLATIAATVAGAIFVLARMAQYMVMFGGRDRNKNAVMTIIPLLVIAIIAPITAMLIQLAISRASEYQADRVGGKICGRPQALASALRRLDEQAHRRPMNVNPTTAHMFIINPLTAKGFATLFMTHPPTQERIRRLLEQAKTTG